MKTKVINVGIDFDDVIAPFMPLFIRRQNEKYGYDYSPREVTDYNLLNLWGQSKEEINSDVIGYITSDRYMQDVYPIPGAIGVINELIAQGINVSIISSRQRQLYRRTLELLSDYFGSTARFRNILLGNSYPLNGITRSKVEMCQRFNIGMMIEDTRMAAKSLAKAGVKVIGFDFNNSYGWSVKQSNTERGIYRATTWEQVLSHVRLFSNSCE